MTENIPTSESLEALNSLISEEPAKEIKTLAPSSDEVVLPGGYISREGILSKTAKVRELNGADEEALAKAGTAGKALNVILNRGTVLIGEEQATKESLEGLLAGDRDAVLLAIRKLTFGNTAKTFAACTCGEVGEVEVDLTEDVEIKSLENPLTDRTWDMDLKAGKVAVTLPNGVIQRKLAENTDKNNAELNTMLLTQCVISVDGLASTGASTVLKLGMSDRQEILEEIVKRNPGPRLGEVKTVCEACGSDVEIPLNLASLFRL